MDPISTSLSSTTKIQNAFEMGTTTPAAVAAAPQTTTSKGGDTVTISDQGKVLAKAASNKGGEAASASIKTNIGHKAATTTAASKTTLTETLQDAQVKQKSLQSKLAEAKIEAQGNPGASSQVASLNAQLRDANTAVTKDQVKVNA